MMSENNTTKDRKYGRKVQGVRRLLGISQEELSQELGYSQSKYSRLEASDEIDDVLLEQIATLLKVPVELIKNFDAQSLSNHFNYNAENGKQNDGFFSSGMVEDSKITINDPEDFSKIYKDIIAEKDKIISQKDKLIEDLQKQIEKSRK